jgi:competence protein ComEC
MTQPGGAGGRIGTWPQPVGIGTARPPLTSRWLAGLTDAFGARLREWAAAEVAPGRLMPWLPVAFGLGVVIYFTAEREPAWWATTGLAVVLGTVAVRLRTRAVAFPLALGCAAFAAGMASGTIKSRLVNHTVLHRAASSVSLAGFVEAREELERSDRFVLGVARIEGPRLSERPQRVRLTVRKGMAPPVGAFVSLKAGLNPPASPFRPGGYDLARDLYFQGIGATGLVRGAIKVEMPPHRARFWLQFLAGIAAIRDMIDGRIRAAVAGDSGSIASALITGRRDTLTGAVNDAMYVSSLAHVLSISGYHMAVVAGVVFFVVRALLALVPQLALNWPIKKWAAAVALLASSFYLILSGAEVATQRSYIMTAVVLLGVLVDRQTLTMRSIAVAALVVMVLVPEAVIHPSFQMSFAATLALIAAYERGIHWAAGPNSSLGARIAMWGLREVALLLLASFVAGLATTPYAAYHFHRVAPYGVIANLFAMPVISAVSMPAGMLALLAMPFGFDAPLWRLMGAGIDWMILVASWVAHLPGAVGRVAAFGVGPLLLATAGLIALCLLRTPLRWGGAVLAALSVAMALAVSRPDVLVSQSGAVMAVRSADGRFTAIKFGSDTLSIDEWLKADGDERRPTDRTVAAGFACDPDGCVAHLADGTAVALSRTLAALADDCARAALVVTLRAPPPDCAAQVLDRRALQNGGSTALTWRKGRFETTPARPAGFDRPWARQPSRSGVAANSHTPATPVSRLPPGDATPPVDDLEPDP